MTDAVKARHFAILGKTPSGKNAVQITRTGRRYPNERFQKWKGEALRQINRNWLNPLFTGPVTALIRYTPGDMIRRDIPGIQDALFHVLEAALVVADDAQVKDLTFKTLPVDREHPGISVYIQEMA